MGHGCRAMTGQTGVGCKRVDYRARAKLIYTERSPLERETETKMDDSTLDADETVSASIDLSQLALRSSGHILQMVEGPGAPRVISLLDERDVVGRSLEASIHVPSGLLSREHMELVTIEGEIQARDLDSRNGVYLNGLRIHAVILRNGDVLQCGDVVFEYKEGV